jgi:hypothetical protein
MTTTCRGYLSQVNEFKGLLDYDLVNGLPRAEAYRFNIERIRQIGEPVGPTEALLEADFYHALRKGVEAGRGSRISHMNAMKYSV